jgi:hypothetical protein
MFRGLGEGVASVFKSRLRPSPYPRIVGRALLAAAHVQVARWDAALRDLEQVQRRELARILARAAGTEFGVSHGFRQTTSYEEFRGGVPVGDYDSFSPYIERMRKGERNLVVPDFIRHYANSSGSSTQGKPKFLPIGHDQIAHQRRSGSDVLMRYLAWRGDAEFTRGFTLGLFPPTTMKEEGPVLVTSNPALMVTELPAFARPLYLPSEAHRNIVNYSEKLGVIAESYLDYDVRAVSGTTCWFSIFFERVLEAARKSGRSVRCVAEIWPNLRVLLGGGVSADPYVPLIRELVGRTDITLIDTYNATEGGLYAASDFTDRPGMLMLPHRGTFFEFVPSEAYTEPNAPRVPLWAVERDRPYVIVVTTASGLYAYNLGDIVRFTETRPPRIEFVGRLSGCLSVTQELTTHVEIERAVAQAVTECPCVTTEFGAGAEIGVAGAKSNYVLFAEFREPPGDLAAFARAFDAALCRENRVYREHRQNEVALRPTRVVKLVEGGARRFLAQVTNGNVQGKFPRIVNQSQLGTLFGYAAEQRLPS